MLTLNQFRNLIFNVVALLTLVSAILTGMLEYKSWTQAPDILVQQSKFDGVNDRIVKTKGNLKDLDVIFIAPNIQDFESTKNQVLVTTGVENQESQLQLIDIKTKIIKPSKIPILPLLGSFLFFNPSLQLKRNSRIITKFYTIFLLNFYKSINIFLV